MNQIKKKVKSSIKTRRTWMWMCIYKKQDKRLIISRRESIYVSLIKCYERSIL